MASNYTHYSDQELLQLIQQKNERAFAVLYERYYLPLYKKAFQRIPSQPVVEEILQDVFVNFWSKAETLDPSGNISAYLYATLRNKILFELRTESNRSFYLKKLQQLAPQQEWNKSLQSIYRKEAEEHINDIISTLSPQCKKAFTLSRFEQLSYKEIAERMHVSVNTVEKHVGKALRILRERLDHYEKALPLIIFILLSICY